MKRIYLILILLFACVLKNILSKGRDFIDIVSIENVKTSEALFGVSLFSYFYPALTNIKGVGKYPHLKIYLGPTGNGWLWVCNSKKQSFESDKRNVFKIHLQVKREFCIPFMTDLTLELHKPDGMFFELEKIDMHKITLTFRSSSRDKGVPISVFYLPRKDIEYLEDKTNRYEFLGGYVQAFVKFTQDWCRKKGLALEDIALDAAPLFNLQINPIVYIAGGDRSRKLREEVEYFLTDDKDFYEGFEFYPSVREF